MVTRRTSEITRRYAHGITIVSRRIRPVRSLLAKRTRSTTSPRNRSLNACQRLQSRYFLYLSHLILVPLRNIGGLHVDMSSKFMADLAKRQRWRYAKAIIEGTSTLTEGLDRDNDAFTESKAKKNLLDRLTDIELRAQEDKKIPEKDLQENFIWAGTHLYASHEDEFFLVRKLVSIPFKIFTGGVIEFGVSIWVWISRARPSVHARLFAEIAKNWEWALRRRKGLFNPALKYTHSFDFR